MYVSGHWQLASSGKIFASAAGQSSVWCLPVLLRGRHHMLEYPAAVLKQKF